MQLKDTEYILTRSTGNEYFGIRPYPLLVTGWFDNGRSISDFVVLADFEIKYNKMYLEKARRWVFLPQDVEVTDQLKLLLEAHGLHLPSYMYREKDKPKPVVTPDIFSSFIQERRKQQEIKKVIETPNLVTEPKKTAEVLSKTIEKLTEKVKPIETTDEGRAERLRRILGNMVTLSGEVRKT